MENLNAKSVGIAVIAALVLGLVAYQLSGAMTATPEVAPVVEPPATGVVTPAPVGEIKAPAKAPTVPKAVETPVKSYSAGCTSAVGTSTTTGVACDGSAPLAFVTETRLPRATSGEPYAVTLTTSGGLKEPVIYAWSVKSKNGGFPVPGLELSNTYGTSVSIKGVPANFYFDDVATKLPVTFTLEVTATAGTQTITKNFNLTVNPFPAE